MKLASRRGLFALLAIGLLAAGVAGFFMSGTVAQAQALQTPPGAPTDLRVTDVSQDNRDGLAWDTPVHDGGDAIIGYQLQRRTTSSDNWETPVNTGSTDTVYTVTKEGSDSGYFYRVRAVNSVDPGAWSNQITVGGRPTWKSGAEGTPWAKSHPTLPRIRLDWAGKLHDNGGKPITGWTWRMKKASSSDFVSKGTVPAGQTRVEATGLEYDTTYDFVVIAHNEDRSSFTSVDGQATTVGKDRGPLIAFYNATGGYNWSTNTNWRTAEPLGRWAGVVTNDDGRVIALDLPNNNLQGSLPAEISNLTELQLLMVRGNGGLSGPLPLSMSGMSSLTHLNAILTQVCAPDDAVLQE